MTNYLKPFTNMKNRKLCTLLLTAAMTIGAQAQVTPVSQM